MTARTDITIDWDLSPRIASVAAPSSEVSVQDSHDTLVGLQDSYEGGQYPDLVSTAGKEDLEGGVKVGLTTTLRDVQYALDRTSSRCSGAVTTADASGRYLKDSLATFQTDGVQRGDWVINFTDQSVTEVVRVDSEIQLYCRILSDGADNQFEIGDTYKVWEVAEASLAGGNFVAIDDVGSAINPMFTTFGRFSSRTSASSATLADLEAIQYSSYQDGVWYDSSSANSGIAYPNGNKEYPVNNITDALSIAVDRGFTRLYFIENSSTVAATDDITGYLVEGVYHDRSVITLTNGCTITNVQFNNLAVQGDAGNDSCVLENCSLRSIDNFNGNVYRSELGGTIKLNMSAYRHWIKCTSNQNTGIPVIDFQGITQDLIVSGYSGDLKIRNMTGGSLEFFADTAYVEIEANCTGGTITMYGNGGLTDNSAGSTVVDDSFISSGGASLNSINAQVTDIENGMGLSQMLRVMFASACGMMDYTDHGDGTYTIHMRDMLNTKNRVTFTGQTAGGRSSAMWDMS